MITIMGCRLVAEERLLPVTVYMGKHLHSTWTINGPEGAVYSTTEPGWMEKESFFHWFQNCFLPAVEDLLQTGPVVLFLDGHHSHWSMDFFELAKESNAHPFCLPSHTSLPATFGSRCVWPTESVWRSILKDYKVATCASNVTKEVCPSMVARLWEKHVLLKRLCKP